VLAFMPRAPNVARSKGAQSVRATIACSLGRGWVGQFPRLVIRTPEGQVLLIGLQLHDE